MEYSCVWTGKYKGCQYKIFKEARPPEIDEPFWWSVKVTIALAQVPEQHHEYFFPTGTLESFPSSGNLYPRWEIPRLGRNYPRDIDAFYVEALYGLENTHRRAVFCWDYQHIWDTGLPRDILEGYIEVDCRNFIDRLVSDFGLLACCRYCGKYGNPEKENWIDPGFGKWQPIHPKCNEERIKYRNSTGRFTDPEDTE